MKKTYECLKNMYLIGRAAEVEDTSAAIEFLVEDKTASFVTGVQLLIDGGLLVGLPVDYTVKLKEFSNNYIISHEECHVIFYLIFSKLD